ncbi:MAG: EF-hand domain-containing protein [Burkholderiales bacterium]
MKKIAAAIALALGTTLAFAGDDAKKVQPSATGDKATTSSPTPQQGQPSGSSAGDSNAGAFWTENARGGHMTKEQAMGYKSADGKPVDFKKLDADGDGKVSQSEWTNYHAAFAQKEGGPEEAGAAGPTAAPEPKPSTK